jgi:diaminopimelate decarboxylase
LGQKVDYFDSHESFAHDYFFIDERRISMKLFGTALTNNQGHLEIGGIDTIELVKQYQTPLYVMDEEQIRQNCRLFKNEFTSEDVETEVIYASKAFLTLAMCNLIDEEGLSLDVVSGGELFTALKANFPPKRIYFHGNNKSDEELKMAVKAQIGRIIIDNVDEIGRLEMISQELNQVASVMLRVNPGIEAHTHEYISTTKNDSKFGESIFDEQIFEIINRIDASPWLDFKGIHSHIGSQIFEEASFYNQINVMMTFVKTVFENTRVSIDELNLGGGFGIYYVEGDAPIRLNEFFKRMLEQVKEIAVRYHVKAPKVLIEPGRAIVANTGTTLYTIGSTKKTYGGKNYIFVDGSMADHIRTALYQAEYEAGLANRMQDGNEEIYTITGKCCESGDLIIKSINLPKPVKGDILAVSSTGAYHYSMASNYNRLLKPAVVFVNNGNSRLVVKRETYDDLIRNDI